MDQEGNTTFTETAWVLKDGTTLAVYENFGGQGFNLTGSEASGAIEGVLAGFIIEVEAGQQTAFYSEASQYFHSTGNSNVNIGGNSFSVTNYAANSPNELVDYCGSDFTYSTFSLSIGTPSGTSFQLVTYLDFSGTETINGNQQAFNYSLTLTAFTVA